MRAWCRAMVAVAFVLTSPTWSLADDVDWPMSLKPFGETLLPKGTPCRKVKESAATAEFLDHTAMLVACPGARSNIVVGKFIEANGGRVVADVDGFTLISVPETTQRFGDGSIVGSVSRTGQLQCTRHSNKPLRACKFSVIRKQGGATTVLVTWPDGGQRAVFFVNGKVRGADTNQADGSAKFKVGSVKELDLFVVTIGEERYDIPTDAVAGD